ncbi:UNVERIFIED_CONTAM: dockerin type I repeat protein [Acetivibrio alkalicellulosi]
MLKEICIVVLTVCVLVGNFSVYANLIEKASTNSEYDRTLLIGDLNYDGRVSSTDYVIANRYILNGIDLKTTDVKSFLASDVNGDGVFNSTDYVLIRRYILQLITSFPVDDIDYMLGDLTGDGKHSYEDIEILEALILDEIDDISPMLMLVADINEDGVVDENDLIFLKEIVYSNSLKLEGVNWYVDGIFTGDLDIVKVYIKGSIDGERATITTFMSGQSEETELKLDESKRFSQLVSLESFEKINIIEENYYSTTITVYNGSDRISHQLKSPNLASEYKEKCYDDRCEAKALATSISDEIIPPEELVDEIQKHLSVIRTTYIELMPQLGRIRYLCDTDWIFVKLDEESYIDVLNGYYSHWDELNYIYKINRILTGGFSNTQNLSSLMFDGPVNAKMYVQLPGILSAGRLELGDSIYTKVINGNRVYLFYRRYDAFEIGIYGFKIENDSPEFLGYYNSDLHYDSKPDWLIEFEKN